MLSLMQDGDAVQRPARSLLAPLAVERVGDGERVGVDLDDRAERGPLPVDRLDRDRGRPR